MGIRTVVFGNLQLVFLKSKVMMDSADDSVRLNFAFMKYEIPELKLYLDVAALTLAKYSHKSRIGNCRM